MEMNEVKIAISDSFHSFGKGIYESIKRIKLPMFEFIYYSDAQYFDIDENKINFGLSGIPIALVACLNSGKLKTDICNYYCVVYKVITFNNQLDFAYVCNMHAQLMCVKYYDWKL